MKTFSKIMTGAAAAALVTTAAVTPAQAQYRDYDRGGIDAGDVIAGVAIVGGIAAIAAAIGGDRGRYGYDNRYGYGQRDGYANAVNACGYQAQRYGGGQVQITDVDRRGGDRYRVRGVIDSGYGGYGGYGYGYDRGYDRYGYGNRGYDRDRFTCTALGNGRVTGFRNRG